MTLKKVFSLKAKKLYIHFFHLELRILGEKAVMSTYELSESTFICKMGFK